MATLEEVIQNLKEQIRSGKCRSAKNGLCYAEKVLRIPGLRNLTVRITMASDGRCFVSMYRGTRVTKQLTIYSDDAEDLKIIASFLEKYADVLNKYATGKRTYVDVEKEVRIDMEDEDEEEPRTKRRSYRTENEEME